MNQPETNPAHAGSAHALLGRWLHWAICNGHVYADKNLTLDTLNMLLPAFTLADVEHGRAVELLLSEGARQTPGMTTPEKVWDQFIQRPPPGGWPIEKPAEV